MPTQNGGSNGVNNPNHRVGDDFDSISGTSPQMIMLDETAASNGRHSSRDSLAADGRDNPGFEADHEHAQGNGKSPEKNGTKTNGTNGHQTPKVPSKSTTDGTVVGGDNVEMVPLNPAAVNSHHKNHNNGKSSTNGSSKTPSKDVKTPLDMTNSDYFRPVNNKRKLFRGQKLYVTSDQRSNSRRWKWIAFWGGVFTFVAAALLTGILAATGIIMSKSTPSYGPPNGLYGNFSANESHTGMEGASEFNFSMVNSTTHHPMTDDEITTKTVTSTTESVPLPGIFPSDGANFNWTDGATHEEHPNAITDHLLHVSTPSTLPSDIDIPIFPINMTSVPFAVVPSVVSTEANESLSVLPTGDGRGRSLDEEITIVAVEDVTLFPAIDNIPSEEENASITILPNAPQPSISPEFQPTLINDTADLVNSTEVTKLPSFEIPVTETKPEIEMSQMNVTHSPTIQPAFDVVANETATTIRPTINLWNDTVLIDNPDIIEDLDGSLSNDSISTNETDVVEEKSLAVNATEPSPHHEMNVTENVFVLPGENVSHGFGHVDREEEPTLDNSLINLSHPFVVNPTTSTSTTELPPTNASHHDDVTLEWKSHDTDLLNATENNANTNSPALPAPTVDQNEEPSNETTVIDAAGSSAVPTPANGSESINSGSTVADHVTDMSPTSSHVVNLTTTVTVLAVDQTEMNTMANDNFTLTESENGTESSTSL